MKRLVTTTALTLIAGAGTAFAGSLAEPVVTPPVLTPQVASADWTGAYAGIQLGYGNLNVANQIDRDGDGDVDGDDLQVVIDHFGQSTASQARRARNTRADNPTGGFSMRSLRRRAILPGDLNNDGVPLLIAYALYLDPNENLGQQMPVPVLVGDSLTLTFHAAAPGVTYTVETSTNLQTWTTDGVAISDLDPTKHCTGSVPLDAPQRFLRLLVSQIP